MNNFVEIIKFINKYSDIWISILVIIGLIRIFKYKEENEKYFILKMIGFYILGCFSCQFYNSNDIIIYFPLGYLIYYLAMKSKTRPNKIAKDKCAKLGLIIFCISFVINGTYNYLEYKDISLSSNGNIKSLSKEWEKIQEKSHMDENLPLNGGRIVYDKNGNIKDLNYYIIDYNKNKSYGINLYDKKYDIVVEKYNEDFTYEYELNPSYDIVTEDFLKTATHIYNENPSKKNMDYNDITYSSHSREDQEYVEEDDVFAVIKNKDTIKYKKLSTENLFIVGPVINYYANVRDSNDEENSYVSNYVFDFAYDKE